MKAGDLEIEVAGVHDSHLRRDRYDEIAGPADPAADLRLGVMHSPEPRVLDRFAADGFDLLLAGHTHGGQICLPGYGALVTNCGIDRAAAQRTAPPSRPDQGEPAPRLAARLGRAGHLAVGAGPVRLPAGGNAAHAGSADRLDFRGFRVARNLAPLRQAAGCGAAWQRASFGTKRPPVQIRPPRLEGLSRSEGFWSTAPGSLF